MNTAKSLRPIAFATLGPALIFLAACGGTPDPEPVPRIAVVCGLDYLRDVTEGFLEGMADLGYVDGENVEFAIYDTHFDQELGRRRIEEEVAAGVDLVLSYPTEISMIAKSIAEPAGVPHVFAIANVEGMGLVDSVRRPGGTSTGVRYPGPDIAARRFDVMLELYPNVRRVLLPYFRDYPIVALQLEVLHRAADPVGIELIECPVSDAEEYREALAAHVKHGEADVDFVLSLAEPLAVMPDAVEVLGEFSQRYRVPVGGTLVSSGEFHSLYGVHVDPGRVGRNCARIADRILKGTPPGDIAVMSAESFFAISPAGARAMGLELDEGVLRMADQVAR